MLKLVIPDGGYLEVLDLRAVLQQAINFTPERVFPFSNPLSYRGFRDAENSYRAACSEKILESYFYETVLVCSIMEEWDLGGDPEKKQGELYKMAVSGYQDVIDLPGFSSQDKEMATLCLGVLFDTFEDDSREAERCFIKSLSAVCDKSAVMGLIDLYNEEHSLEFAEDVWARVKYGLKCGAAANGEVYDLIIEVNDLMESL